MQFKQFLSASAAAASMAVAGPALAVDYSLTQPNTTPSVTVTGAGVTSAAIFTWTVAQSTGTGVFDPFLRIQGAPTEDGFNTDAKLPANSNPELDDVKGGTWTHSIKLTDVPMLQFDGTWYYEFGLDLDEPNNRTRFITLEELRFYRATTGDRTTLNGLTALWTLGSNSILMDGSLNPGNGGGDMRAYIRASDLQAGTGDYLYLWSKFGDAEVSTDGSFEEWGLRAVTAPIPEPSTYALMFAGLAAVGFMARRRRQA